MSRRRKQTPPPATTPSFVNAPLPVAVLLQRISLGALTALIVSRPLVAGHDPNRLSLTSSGAEITFNTCVLLLLLVTTVKRIFDRSRTRFDWGPLLLIGVGLLCYVSGQQADRYARPALYQAWEWCSIAAVFWLARHGPRSERDSRGLLNALLASVFSVAALGVYQVGTKPLALPTSELPLPRTDLAGNDEFYPALNAAVVADGPKGTFDQPQTLAVFLLLTLPVCVLIARTAWSKGRAYRFVVALPLVVFCAFYAAVAHSSWSVDWSAGWSLWQEHRWWGVGPGNFTRRVSDPSTPAGGWLTFAATTGLFTVVVLALFAALIIRGLRRPVIAEEQSTVRILVRWEFYYGGIVGLLLGLVWVSAEIPVEASSDEVFRLGAVAVGRAVVWFVAFGILENVRPRLVPLTRWLVVGVLAVLLSGLLSNVVLLPTILFPLVVVLGLLMNWRQEPAISVSTWGQPLAVATAVNALVLFVLYLMSAALPAWGTAKAIREARLASMFFSDKDRQIDLAANRVERANAITEARNYLRGTITIPLREALRQDPNNTALMLEIARWQRPLYRYQTFIDPKAAAETARDNLRLGDAASKLDPHNLASARNLYESLLTYQKEAGVNVKPKERLEAINKQIAKIAASEPQSEIPLRYRMVFALLDGGDLLGVEVEISRLFRLLRVEGSPHGTLTTEQRMNLIDRAKKSLTQLPKELLEEWVE